MKHYGILGAGPSGLLASLFLNSENTVLEKDSRAGGLCRSHVEAGFTFDYGSHILFSKNQTVLEFMLKSLGDNVSRHKRNNKVFYKDRFVKYPFENELSALPVEDTFECLYSYLFNPNKKKYSHPTNLKQWLLKTFGDGICEKYLFPYNEKVWNLPVEKLSMLWSERIPNPPLSDIVKSALGIPTEGYLHQLYYNYPQKGGFQKLTEAWASQVKNLVLDFKASKITKQKSGKWLVSNSKQEYEFDELISTIPIHELVKILKVDIPSRVRTAISKLIVNPMCLVFIGIKGNNPNPYTAVYFPAADFWVNRVGYQTDFSKFNAPAGHYALQAEITFKKNSPTGKLSDQEIIDHVVGRLTKDKFIKKENIVFTHLARVPYAYVVYDRDYEKNVKIIRDWFPRQGIHLLGRFSYFEYINVDAVVERAQEIIGKINGKPIRLEKYLSG